MGSRGAGSGRISPTSKGHSISGKPFNANDYTTWQVGQEVQMQNERDVGIVDGQIRRGADRGYSDGIVKEVHSDHLIVSVPNVSDKMWVDEDTASMFRAKKKR